MEISVDTNLRAVKTTLAYRPQCKQQKTEKSGNEMKSEQKIIQKNDYWMLRFLYVKKWL